jgi:hypothetical protein
VRDAFTNTDCDGNGNRDGNRYSDSNRYRNGDTYGNGDAYAEACSNAETASDAAAAPVNRVTPLNAGTREALREFLQGVKGGTRSPRSFCKGSRCRLQTNSQAARLPLQSRSIDHDYFALVRPLVCGCHKASADRIVPHVVPFLGVTFVAPQNVIKESRLPQ